MVTKYVNNDKPSWKCVACPTVRQGNAQLEHILKHALSCKALREFDAQLWQDALEESRQGSLGAIIADQPTSEATTAVTQLDEPATKKPRVQVQAKLDVEQLQATGKKAKDELLKLFQARVDHVIMRLICVRGLVPNLIDSPEWKELMTLLNGSYHPTSGDLFHDKIIPREAV